MRIRNAAGVVAVKGGVGLFNFPLFVGLLFGVPFALARAGAVIAVAGKASRGFPYQPDEDRVFGRPLLPRWYSKVYVVEPPPRPRRNR